MQVAPLVSMTQMETLAHWVTLIYRTKKDANHGCNFGNDIGGANLSWHLKLGPQ